MNESFDKKLRAALRPVDPGEDFTARVMEKITDEKIEPRVAQGSHFGGHRRWALTALAASLVAASFIGFKVHQQRDREEGLRARQQVLDALQVTSAKLNLAYRAVRDQSHEIDVSDPDGA